ncbi:hypothetical protein ABT278_35685 [Streptomyces sp. NPDC001228]|uniref:hypothetical protein n=1 Tax=Streptomyces sp. NPDC001228 TaxID=3154381 RepID=UPI00331BB3A1
MHLSPRPPLPGKDPHPLAPTYLTSIVPADLADHLRGDGHEILAIGISLIVKTCDNSCCKAPRSAPLTSTPTESARLISHMEAARQAARPRGGDFTRNPDLDTVRPDAPPAGRG